MARWQTRADRFDMMGGRICVTDPPQAEINGKDIWESLLHDGRARLYTMAAQAICDGAAARA